MVKERAEIDGGTYVHSEVLFTQFEGHLRRVSLAHRHVRVLRTKELGEHVSSRFW